MRFHPEILMEDGDILVCRKPAGVPVQTGRTGQPDLERALKNYRALKKEPPEIYIVHRLDQPVEGVMVFAKNRKAAAFLSKQIQEKGVGKYYYAVTEGVVEPREGTLTDFLMRDGKSNTSRVVAEGTKNAKKAVLSYRRIQSLEGKSLVEICLHTGRHHQIRVQMAHAGYPLIGDRKYSTGCGEIYMPVGLCSVRIEFLHPSTGKRIEYDMAPQGEAFQLFGEIRQNFTDKSLN